MSTTTVLASADAAQASTEDQLTALHDWLGQAEAAAWWIIDAHPSSYHPEAGVACPCGQPVRELCAYRPTALRALKAFRAGRPAQSHQVDVFPPPSARDAHGGYAATAPLPAVDFDIDRIRLIEMFESHNTTRKPRPYAARDSRELAGVSV